MILRSLLYAVGVYVLTAIVSLLVAGVIIIIYKIVHRDNVKKQEDKVEIKPAA